MPIAGLYFVGIAGGAAPAPQTLQLRTSARLLNFTAAPSTSDGLNWLRIAAPSGSTAAGSPAVINRQGSSSFQLASEAATRAIMQCQPFDMPADKYDGGWAEVELNFDPRGMF